MFSDILDTLERIEERLTELEVSSGNAGYDIDDLDRLTRRYD
jgi:hypothetical protein